MIEEKKMYKVLVGCGNRSGVCMKRIKVEAKDRLKDKYRYFILVLIMHVIYDSHL